MPDQDPRFVVQHLGYADEAMKHEQCLVVDTRWNKPIRMDKIFERDLAQAIADILNRRPYAANNKTTNPADSIHRAEASQRSGNAPSSQPSDSLSEGTRLRSSRRRDNGTIQGRRRLVSRELARCHGCGQREGQPHFHYCDVEG